MPDEQPAQQRKVGIQNELLEELVCGYADTRAVALQQQQEMAAQAARYQEITQKGSEHVSALQAENDHLTAQVARLEAHRCPVLGEFGEGDDEDMPPVRHQFVSVSRGSQEVQAVIDHLAASQNGAGG